MAHSYSHILMGSMAAEQLFEFQVDRDLFKLITVQRAGRSLTVTGACWSNGSNRCSQGWDWLTFTREKGF